MKIGIHAERSAHGFLPNTLRPVNLRAVFFLLAGTTGIALADVRYVDGNSGDPVPPFIGWATAARLIPDAVDAALPGDMVLVTNGIYATGGLAVSGTMTNRGPLPTR